MPGRSPRVAEAFVPIRYSREFPHPLEQAYAWLTDYRDDDPQRTDAVQVERRVLRVDGDTIRMTGKLHILGSTGEGEVEVKLIPPYRWRATLVKGAGRGSVYEYRLTPTGKDRTRLDVVYNVRAKRFSRRVQLWFARPFVRRELARMWDGYARSMAKDLAAAPAAVEAR